MRMNANPRHVAAFILIGFVFCAWGISLAYFTTENDSKLITRGAQSSIPAMKFSNIPPAVLPVEYLPLTRAEALTKNGVPAVDDIGPSARPFFLEGESDSRLRARQCLTQAVYYEAASQDKSGQQAVAQVVINRVRNAAFPSSVCGVVYQGAERATGCQFTFTCDGGLSRVMAGEGLAQARTVAARALAGHVFKGVGNATHYHADWLVPYWAVSLIRVTKIGTHIFYRWKGSWGLPRAFTQKYAAREPDRVILHVLPTEAALSLPTGPESQAGHKGSASRPTLAEDTRTRNSILIVEISNSHKLVADETPNVLIPSLRSK